MKYEFHTIRREREKFVDYNLFAPANLSGWRGLVERAAFSVLRRLGCFRHGEADSYKRVSIEIDSLMNLIRAQADECRYRSNREIKGVILGPEEAEKLNIECTHCMMFTVPYYCERPQFQGIDLYILPWAKGVTLLPKLD